MPALLPCPEPLCKTSPLERPYRAGAGESSSSSGMMAPTWKRAGSTSATTLRRVLLRVGLRPVGCLAGPGTRTAPPNGAAGCSSAESNASRRDLEPGPIPAVSPGRQQHSEREKRRERWAMLPARPRLLRSPPLHPDQRPSRQPRPLPDAGLRHPAAPISTVNLSV